MGLAADLLRLVRAPLGPTAACDALACAWLARGPGFSGGPGSLPLGEAAALAAAGLLVYAAGMAGNDLADRERDRTIHPERPLPSGRLGTAAAALVVAACAAGAMALGLGPLSSPVPVALALACAAAYDAGGKRSLVGGALLMGGARASNAATGVLPLVLAGAASPWALVGPALCGLYSASVTALSTGEDRPARAAVRRLAGRVGAGAVFAGAAAVAWAGARGPTVGAFLAAGIVTSCAFGRVPRPGPVKAQVLEMMLGFYWLACALAGGARPGSDWGFGLATLGGAYALAILSQVAVRALRPAAPAPTDGEAPSAGTPA